jgi:hypothetical protein
MESMIRRLERHRRHEGPGAHDPAPHQWERNLVSKTAPVLVPPFFLLRHSLVTRRTYDTRAAEWSIYKDLQQLTERVEIYAGDSVNARRIDEPVNQLVE